MSGKRITIAGNSPTLLLPQDVLDKMGVDVGDEVEMSIVDRTLILQPLGEGDRAQKIEAVTEAVFKRRQSAYERLAQEVE